MRRETRPTSRLILSRPVGGAAVNVLIAAVVAATSLALVPSGFWLVVALVAGGLAAVLPRTHAAWVWMLLVAAAVLAQDPSGLDWRQHLALFGIHVVHVLASLSLVISWRSRVELAVLTRPLRGFVAIQLPAQLLLLVAVLVQRSAPTGLQILAPVGALAVIGIVVLLVSALRRGELTRRRR